MTKIDKSDAIEKYKILLDHISHLDSISYKYRFFAATVFGGFVASVWLVVTSLGMKDASIILFSIISLFTIGCIITISLTDFLNQEYKEASIRNCERLEKFTVEELHTGIFFNRFSSLQRSVTPLTTNLALIVFYAFPIFCIYTAMVVVWVSIEGIYFHGIFEHLVRALCDRSVDLEVRNACVENHNLTVLSSDTIFFCFHDI